MLRVAGLALLACATALPAADLPAVSFRVGPKQVEITVGGRPVGAYVFRDGAIPRPYFAHLRAPGGAQVTRNHPPVRGKDATDHADFHPGLWLAFGDLGGTDFWRNKGLVRHAGFIEPPQGGAGRGSFAVRNVYEADGRTRRPFKLYTVGPDTSPVRMTAGLLVVPNHTYADAPHLNGQYTVLGEVVSGMDNVDKIKKGEPVQDPDRITRAFVQADKK